MLLKCLRSTYRGSKKDEFYLEILDEVVAIPSGFNQPEDCYKVRVFDGQGFKTDVHWLRKTLIGTLYEVVDTPNQFLPSQNKQLTIFDFM